MVDRVRRALRRVVENDLSWAFAAIWLFFLGYPIVAVVTSDRSSAAIAYALTMIVVFAMIYIAASIHIMRFRARSGRRRTAVAYLVTLTAVAFAVAPVVGDGAVAFAPYLMGVAVFGLGGILGQSVVFLVLAAIVFAPLAVPGWEFDAGTLLTFTVVALVMSGANALQVKEREREDAEERRREADEQLAVVAERERVARDVHDILGHTLTVMTLKSELAGRLVDIDPGRAKAELAELHTMSREALAEVRATVGALRTPELRTELSAARTALTAAAIDADVPEQVRDLPTPRQTLFAWVVREAVTNVVRHSGAASCTIRMDEKRVSIVDNGCGIPDHAFGNGLRGLTERVESAGARLRVSGAHPGTRVEVSF